jgi:nitrogen fixation-related uncharacterized protein
MIPIIYYVLVFGLIAAFSASVVWAFWWAVRGGQLSEFQKGATSIFDADEPVGRPTEGLPRTDRKESPQ